MGPRIVTIKTKTVKPPSPLKNPLGAVRQFNPLNQLSKKTKQSLPAPLVKKPRADYMGEV